MPLARLQVRDALTARDAACRTPRVWCWEGLWAFVLENVKDGPARLSPASRLAALDAALDRARASGAVASGSPLLAWPSARRRLSARIAGWTEAERAPDDDERIDARASAEELSVYAHYRILLGEMGVEDDESAAVWASRRLERQARRPASKFDTVTLLAPWRDTLATRRARRFFEASAKAVRVVLVHDPDPHLADVYRESARLREALLEEGYREEVVATDAERPAGLCALGRELFRDDAHRRPMIDAVEGLTLLGGPEGEGSAMLIAREITHRITERHVDPEEILVLTRGGDENRDILVETLRAWDLPVSDLGRARPFAREPAVGALLMAMRLSAGDWETMELTRLLRHGGFRPEWAPGNSARVRARAASLLRGFGIFRGRAPIRAAFAQAIEQSEDNREIREIAEARDVVDRVIAFTEVVDQPGRWPAHRARIQRLARELGLGGEALDDFWDALENYASLAEEVAAESVAFSDVLAAFEGLAGEVGRDRRPPVSGSIVVTTPDQAAGAEARWVFLTDLAEGTFPTRDAVEQAEHEGEPSRVGPAYGREMALFLRTVGSARQGLTLVYPTRDEKGQEVLPSGFLDELMQRIAAEALKSIHEKHQRFHPALIGEHERDLAGSAAEARVQAMALACINNEPAMLAELAKDPRHRGPLEGSAAALRLAGHRFADKHFNIHDGRIDRPEVARVLAERLGPEYRFSPSQLESYRFCGFQFFMKYVLKLEPVEEKEELDEDFIERGNQVHKLLEEIEQMRKQEPADVLEIAEIVLEARMSAELTVGAETDALHQIEVGQLRRILSRYASQARSYEAAGGPRPESFEFKFGDDLTFLLGEGANAVRIRGTIDRVDVVPTEGGTGLRVIDYKTGRPPSDTEVRELLMVQLPLYALAIERLRAAEGVAGVVDMGYWDLREGGFKAVKLDWAEIRDQLEASVLGVVGRMRQGRFEVNPRTLDCTRKCDFKSVCRIGQVRAAGKTNEEEPS